MMNWFNSIGCTNVLLVAIGFMLYLDITSRDKDVERISKIGETVVNAIKSSQR